MKLFINDINDETKHMGKNIFDLGFSIKREDEFYSCPWRLWITSPGDVYLTTSGSGGTHKYSFHKSGICRSAFTKEYAAKNFTENEDRAVHKWKRLQTPKRGRNEGARVVWIAFPTDFLSRPEKPFKKKYLPIAAAGVKAATYIELVFTFESEKNVNSQLTSSGRELRSYTKLPNGESFFVSSYHSDCENKDITSPSGKGSGIPDLLFSAEDPKNTGRPYRLLYGPIPQDNDALILTEIGGFLKNS